MVNSSQSTRASFWSATDRRQHTTSSRKALPSKHTNVFELCYKGVPNTCLVGGHSLRAVRGGFRCMLPAVVGCGWWFLAVVWGVGSPVVSCGLWFLVVVLFVVSGGIAGCTKHVDSGFWCCCAAGELAFKACGLWVCCQRGWFPLGLVYFGRSGHCLKDAGNYVCKDDDSNQEPKAGSGAVTTTLGTLCLRRSIACGL
eukprot:m.206766 g.206766  ORF g.206766 m.206766 type:complete len:198 (-) comp18506_c1_seq2:872-1465(-)